MTSDIIDITKLPKPEVIEPLDLLAIKDAVQKDFVTRYGPGYQLTEADPAFKVLETGAYRETLTRNRMNESARQVMPAFATGANLDHIVLRARILRKPDETDASLLARFLDADDDPSTAGSPAGYRVHAMKAVPAGVLVDVRALSPSPCVVEVWCLFNQSVKPEDRPGHLATVAQYLDQVSPLDELRTVKESPVKRFTFKATIYTLSGASPDVIKMRAEFSLASLFERHFRVGSNIWPSEIYAAIHDKNDVERAEINSPREGVTVLPGETPLLADSDDAISLEVKKAGANG